MKFPISKVYLDKRCRSPFIMTIQIVMISMSTYLMGDWTFSKVFTYTALVLAFSVLPNWVGAKRYIKETENHHIEIQGSAILSFGKGYKLETDLSLINNIVLNMSKSGVKSIILKANKRVAARLENYENINELADLIKKATPNATIIGKRWIHS